MDGVLEVVEGIELGAQERGDEGLVLLPGHWRVQVVAAVTLAVARLPIERFVVERVRRDDGRDGVIEVQTVAAEEVVDGLEERVGREGAGGHDEEVGVAAVERGYLVATQGDLRLCSDRRGDLGGEPVAVDGEGVTCRHARGLTAADDERLHQRHLGLEEPDGIGLSIRAEGVGADELREVGGLMGGRALHGPHLVQLDAMSAPRQTEGALRAGEAGADDFDRRHVRFSGVGSC